MQITHEQPARAETPVLPNQAADQPHHYRSILAVPIDATIAGDSTIAANASPSSNSLIAPSPAAAAREPEARERLQAAGGQLYGLVEFIGLYA